MSIYDPESSNSKMQYEEVTVFLQEEVSIIRKAACEVYKSVKVRCETLQAGCRPFMTFSLRTSVLR